MIYAYITKLYFLVTWAICFKLARAHNYVFCFMYHDQYTAIS